MKETGNKLVEPALCPACGKQFHCSTSSKCWCYEHQLPDELLDKLKNEFEGCLCPECISGILQNP
jgi:hypothetical protein